MFTNVLLPDIYAGLLNSGKTVLYFANKNHIIGIIAVADTIKETSYQAIKELKKEDMETATITQTINLTKQDGKWVINTTDTNLIDILLPGLNEAVNSLS